MRDFLTLPFLGIICIYQRAISPFLPKRCRFFPSCSAYAYDSLKRFGLFEGIFLIIKRLLKCQPFHQGGFDPVPHAKALKRK